VAAFIKKGTGLDADLVEGARGEFTVWVGDEQVAQKTSDGFPTEQEALSAVQRALEKVGKA
jgi:hypothetical protein